jgi:LacI family transcriptional regulator
MISDRRPTIIDVAQKAGVSKSTVSLVLQNSPAVREETRAQVRQAMADIGYVYNRAAANMRMSNAGLIGLVINDLRNPFFTEFATSLQMALSERGYAVVIANTDEDPRVQAQTVGTMVEHGVSAFIISPAYGDASATFDAILRASLPAMQVLRKVDPRTNLLPFSGPDYLAGSRMATRHLLDQGAKRVAFVGGLEGRAVTQERMSGYLEVLRAEGIAPLVLSGKSSRAFGREMAHVLTREKPDCDAALCFNDLVALGMLTGCNELGRNVGADFKIVGFDDIEDAAQAYPALTTVRCDVAGFGRRTAATILDWLENGKIPLPESRSPVELVIRQSSQWPPIRP